MKKTIASSALARKAYELGSGTVLVFSVLTPTNPVQALPPLAPQALSKTSATIASSGGSLDQLLNGTECIAAGSAEHESEGTNRVRASGVRSGGRCGIVEIPEATKVEIVRVGIGTSIVRRSAVMSAAERPRRNVTKPNTVIEPKSAWKACVDQDQVGIHCESYIDFPANER
ncbi:MAG TPA: hypothetical protein VKX49_06400 [Bryobacteraceae bacterium]|nr:hypothetical protein [Bryobacteraceae bacterium]